MPSITVDYTTIADSAVDPDSPVSTELVTALRDNPEFVKQWLGASYVAGAVQDHNHDGVNSAPVVVGVAGLGASLGVKLAVGSTRDIDLSSYTDHASKLLVVRNFQPAAAFQPIIRFSSSGAGPFDSGANYATDQGGGGQAYLPLFSSSYDTGMLIGANAAWNIWILDHYRTGTAGHIIVVEGGSVRSGSVIGVNYVGAWLSSAAINAIRVEDFGGGGTIDWQLMGLSQ